MSKRVTYPDTGVFIYAWRGEDAYLKQRARELLQDLGREFVGSHMLELELLPSAFKQGNTKEIRLLLQMLSRVTRRVPLTQQLAERALEIGTTYGVLGADCLHLAAAESAGSDEFISREGSDSGVYRVPSVKGIQLEYADILVCGSWKTAYARPTSAPTPLEH